MAKKKNPFKFFILFLVILLFVPITLWSIYKPLRVLAPGFVPGVNCPKENFCLDNESRLPEALNLYSDALQFVEDNISPIKAYPKIVFCDSKACFASFGLDKQAAFALGNFGIIISPRGWKAHFIRHELIHHVHSEKVGPIKLFLTPKWLKEGLAYELSKDPRKHLEEPFETYRNKYKEWRIQSQSQPLWVALKNY